MEASQKSNAMLTPFSYETPDENGEYLAEVDYREARLCEDYILINHDLEDLIFFAERVMVSLRWNNRG